MKKLAVISLAVMALAVILACGSDSTTPAAAPAAAPAGAPATAPAGAPATAPAADAAAPAAPATGNADLNFTLVNKTGVPINNLYMSPSSSNNWEEDMLGNNQMADGASLPITFHGYNSSVAKWDLKAMDEAGTAITWTGLDLTTISKLTLTIENGQPMARIE